MIKKEIKLIFRGVKKQLVISAINIFGLAIGFTFVILAGVYAIFELRFDRFHDNHKSIYRIEWSTPTMNTCSTPGIMRSWLNSNIPEIVNSTRILNDGGGFTERNIIYNKTKYNISNPLIVDKDFFSMFSFDVLMGEIKSFESDKYSVALSRPLADKIFGDALPLGKTIEYKGKTFTVRAVMDALPPNSSIKFEMLLPASNMPDYVTMDWRNNTLQTFIEAGNLLPGKQLQQKINDGIITTLNSLGYAEQAKSRTYLLNPLDNIYYSASLYDNLCVHGDIKTTILLISLVAIVLLIALLNYVNIIMSGASESIRNVGIRSVFGSSRTDNIRFFFFLNT